MKTGIYKITNCVTGDFYVGSAVSILLRFSIHRSKLRKKYHDNLHFQSSWNKYGEDAFVFEIVEECNKEKLIEREQFYIDTLKPTINKRIVAYSNIGISLSKETRYKLSESRKRFLKTLPNTDILKTRSKPVLQFDRTGTFIAEHLSSKDASVNIKVKDYTCINKVCNGLRKSAYNYIWKFKN
jgi:group I intron endonuclease